jgi:hypothetical protein
MRASPSSEPPIRLTVFLSSFQTSSIAMAAECADRFS